MRTLETVFSPNNAWLLAQPEFTNGWATGRVWVKSFLDDCEVRYGKFMGTDPRAGSPRGVVDVCRDALAEALLYHWHWHDTWVASSRQSVGEGAPGGAWVVQVLRAGFRPTTPEEVERAPQQMGGDPFRDLVVTVGTIHGVAPAFAQFDEDYRGDFEQLARQFPEPADGRGEWGELLVRLVSPRSGKGKSVEPPPLARYSGYTSLRHWLRPVMRNFLMDVTRRLKARVAAETRRLSYVEGHASFESGVADRAAELGLEAVLDSLSGALAQLAPQDRELLLCEHRLGETNREIANRLGISEGQASRLRRKAHTTLGAALSRDVTESVFLPDNPAAAEVWQGVLRTLPPDLLGSLIRLRTG